MWSILKTGVIFGNQFSKTLFRPSNGSDLRSRLFRNRTSNANRVTGTPDFRTVRARIFSKSGLPFSSRMQISQSITNCFLILESVAMISGYQLVASFLLRGESVRCLRVRDSRRTSTRRSIPLENGGLFEASISSIDLRSITDVKTVLVLSASRMTQAFVPPSRRRFANEPQPSDCIRTEFRHRRNTHDQHPMQCLDGSHRPIPDRDRSSSWDSCRTRWFEANLIHGTAHVTHGSLGALPLGPNELRPAPTCCSVRTTAQAAARWRL